MAWFGGSVDEAVKICKQRAGLLTIFVRDTSDESHALEEIFGDPDVAAIPAKYGDVLLLKITQGTTNFDLLNSVYPVASIPMIQFIDGSNGMLLFSVTPTNKDDIMKGLNDGIDTWVRQRIPPATARHAEVHQATSSSTNVRDDPDPADDVQARAARAQERIAQIREQKAREAERLQREKEIQRRKDGQLTANAERERQANQAEQIRLDLEKEKKVEAAHRQRVLDNLRQDKEDRERRLKETRDLTASTSPVTTTATASGASLPAAADYTKSKIQFRYEAAEGMRSFIGDFEAEDEFSRAISFVKKETGLTGRLTLRQLYPRRDFSDTEGKQTLKSLDLVPNAVLLVIPANSTRPGVPGGATGLLSRILAEFWKLLLLPIQGANALIGYVFPRPRIEDTRARPTTYSAARGSSSDRPGSNVRQRRPTEDATYNGNSTQQL